MGTELTNDEIQFIKNNFKTKGTKYCAQKLKKCRSTILNHARKLHLYKIGTRKKYNNEKIFKLLKKHKIELLEHTDIISKRCQMRCYCGKIFYCPPQRILRGDSKSCGCYSSQAKSQRSRKDITGLKSGKLTAIKLSYIKNNRTYWLCKCSCGKEHTVPIDCLTLKTTKSCGKCLLRRNGIMTSHIALKLHQMLIDEGYPTGNEDHNYKIKGRKYIDIAIPKFKIAIEYNGRYYHRNKKLKDKNRIKELKVLGWNILIIRSNRKLPKISTINKRIEKLKNGSNYEVITMKDWYEK